MGRYQGTEWGSAAPLAEAAAEQLTEGLLAGTSVATAESWRVVETIRPGERVLTCDAGPQPVVAVEQASRAVPDLTGLPHLWPLAVPPQALGNSAPLLLLPEQPVLTEAEASRRLSWGEAAELLRSWAA